MSHGHRSAAGERGRRQRTLLPQPRDRPLQRLLGAGGGAGRGGGGGGGRPPPPPRPPPAPACACQRAAPARSAARPGACCASAATSRRARCALAPSRGRLASSSATSAPTCRRTRRQGGVNAGRDGQASQSACQVAMSTACRKIAGGRRSASVRSMEVAGQACTELRPCDPTRAHR